MINITGNYNTVTIEGDCVQIALTQEQFEQMLEIGLKSLKK